MENGTPLKQRKQDTEYAQYLANVYEGYEKPNGIKCCFSFVASFDKFKGLKKEPLAYDEKLVAKNSLSYPQIRQLTE